MVQRRIAPSGGLRLRFDVDRTKLAGTHRGIVSITAALTQRRTPFAFVTGYGREALPLGFREAMIVEKPFTQEQLTGALERLLAPGDNVSSLRSRRSN